MSCNSGETGTIWIEWRKGLGKISLISGMKLQSEWIRKYNRPTGSYVLLEGDSSVWVTSKEGKEMRVTVDEIGCKGVTNIVCRSW